jgi:hypothetical protein
MRCRTPALPNDTRCLHHSPHTAALRARRNRLGGLGRQTQRAGELEASLNRIARAEKRIEALEGIVVTLATVDEVAATWDDMEREFEEKLEVALVQFGTAFTGRA